MKMEQTQCSETSAYKIQTPGNYPEESIQQKNYLPFFGLKGHSQPTLLPQKEKVGYNPV
jgi:hypothetical protein